MDVNEVTLLGHKDHGKSTLIGNLLITTKSVSEQRINDAKKTSKKLGRDFEPGFILDSFEEERTGGLTIDTTRAQILYKDNAFEFIDVPGHEELIKNMISGASNADFAVLMVSAKEDEGIRDQTLRHLYLAGMLGIRKLIVAVNKMDKVAYSQDKFESIKRTISKFLIKIGFEGKNVFFIPISAYNAENLTTKSKNMKWYGAEPLLDIMVRQSKSSGKAVNPELRIAVQGVLEEEDLVIGRIISGNLRKGQDIVVLPQDNSYKVNEIYIKGKRASLGRSGHNVALKLNKNISVGIRGSIICGTDKPLRPTRKFNALVFAVKAPGKSSTIKFNGNSIDCKMHISEVIDTTTGESISTSLKPLNAAKATVEISSPIVAEPFSKSEELGRFVLYENGEFSGIGVII